MDALLIVLGSLGFSAVLVSVYIFMVAARNYVSDEPGKFRHRSRPGQPHRLAVRNSSDRRGNRAVVFPLTVNGILITHDRRHLQDRRIAI